jgi:hypothetical protein
MDQRRFADSVAAPNADKLIGRDLEIQPVEEEALRPLMAIDDVFEAKCS